MEYISGNGFFYALFSPLGWQKLASAGPREASNVRPQLGYILRSIMRITRLTQSATCSAQFRLQVYPLIFLGVCALYQVGQVQDFSLIREVLPVAGCSLMAHTPPCWCNALTPSAASAAASPPFGLSASFGSGLFAMSLGWEEGCFKILIHFLKI